MNGELDAALSAYNQALHHDPQFAAASLNRQRVEERLRQQFREQQQAEQQKHEAAHLSGTPDKLATFDPNANAADTTNDFPEEENASRLNPSRRHRVTPATPNSTESTDEALHSTPLPVPTGDDFDPKAFERQQALEQWLRQIPDEPAELLRQKFRYELQQQEKPF